VGSGLADAAAQLSLLAQDAPDKLVQEIQLFWEEVELEADRLEHGDDASVADGVTMTHPTASEGFPATADPQAQIDALRAQVASLVSRLDQASQASQSSSGLQSS
jgi:predicted phage gp36 major capsid-like protein